MTNPHDALCAHISAINACIMQAKAAIRLPDKRVNDVLAMHAVSKGYGHSALTENQQHVAERMWKLAVEEERRAGEVARDREMKRLAAELDVLRRELPALAEAARFHLCDIAREMRQ